MSPPLPPPDLEQNEIIRRPIEDLLVVAPAGSGKTLALAWRAKRLLEDPALAVPRRLLALTFSNRAKANLVTRISTAVGPGWRNRVDIQNFHGFSARVINSHGSVLGLDPESFTLPDEPWRRRLFSDIPFRDRPAVEKAIRDAKTGTFSDDEVLERLEETGLEAAIGIENQIRVDGRIDYDDIIRHAARVLLNPTVAALYANHYGAVLVDEVQDLTILQLQLVTSFGAGRTTFAGDMTQGIYGFAGAAPTEVFSLLQERCAAVLNLSKSWRSSNAVIRTLNAFAVHCGGEVVEAAGSEVGTLPRAGTVLTLESSSLNDETEALLNYLLSHTLSHPSDSVAIIARRGTRLARIRRGLKDRNVPFEDWTSSEHDVVAAETILRHLTAALSASDEPVDQLEVLATLCLSDLESFDVETRDAVVSALSSITEAIALGGTLREAVTLGRPTRESEEHAGAGIHLLNGHVGKGQEFDVVIVLGLEEGLIPDFRGSTGPELDEEARVLHVMLSRARDTLVLVRCTVQSTRLGMRGVDASRWWPVLVGSSTGRLTG